LVRQNEGPKRLVWARKEVAIHTCPVSYITPQSQTFLEKYAVWKLLGERFSGTRAARTVDAFCVLEGELKKELRDGDQ